MASNYYPFLKAKLYEILALSRLQSEQKQKVIPCFDLPANTHEDDPEHVGAKIVKLCKHAERYFSSLVNGFFIDHFDIDPRIRLCDGSHPYSLTLRSLSAYGARPVIGLDRDDNFLAVAESFAREVNHYGLRLLPEDIMSPDDAIEESVALIDRLRLLRVPVTLFLDLRILPTSEPDLNIAVACALAVADELRKALPVASSVVVGTSMPLQLTDDIGPGQNGRILRFEPKMWTSFLAGSGAANVGIGDYCTVSAEYVEIPPHLYRTVMTAKGIYTETDSYYVSRKRKIEQFGNEQFYEVASDITTRAAFRGGSASHGDKHIEDVAGRVVPKPGAPSSWLSASINSHMAFTISRLPV